MRKIDGQRRRFIQGACSSFGWLALSGLTRLSQAKQQDESALAQKKTHFPARAKQVIFLCMKGGPSHVDTFDYKPALMAADGKSSERPGRIRNAKLMGSPWKFQQHGESGRFVSSLFPEVGQQADRLCMLHSLQTDLPAHPQAYLMLHTGSSQFIRPSLGAWTIYGLGTDNEDLPGFISIKPTGGNGGARNYGSAFLPSACQATRIGNEGRPVEQARIGNINNSTLSDPQQRLQLDLIQSMNRELIEREGTYPDAEGIVESYDLAYRMQDAFPDLMDLDQETETTNRLYGLNNPVTADFGRQCLLARRCVEKGVRFVELTHGDWDQHRGLQAGHAQNARAVDQPIAGLLTDLAERGLLEETLVVWGGEFGRTPHGQNADGRDHNNKGFTMWMAGGGVKKGYSYGATDELGYEVVEDPVHIHDLHATILHLLGLDHERLTYRYAGRDMRLTDTAGRVVTDIMA